MKHTMASVSLFKESAFFTNHHLVIHHWHQTWSSQGVVYTSTTSKGGHVYAPAESPNPFGHLSSARAHKRHLAKGGTQCTVPHATPHEKESISCRPLTYQGCDLHYNRHSNGSQRSTEEFGETEPVCN